MKAKNVVYWCGGLVLLLGTVLAAAGAGPAAGQVISLWPAGVEQRRICVDMMCPDGSHPDEFCRCPTVTTSSANTPVAANQMGPTTVVVDKVASLWPAGAGEQARICVDMMCPDGSHPDAFCRCRPRACIDLMCPDGTPRDEFCRCRPRACVDVMCPDGSHPDEFCRCPISTNS